MNEANKETWVSEDYICAKCNCMIILCQSKKFDYHIYCSNKLCENHAGVEVYDSYDHNDVKILLPMVKKVKSHYEKVAEQFRGLATVAQENDCIIIKPIQPRIKIPKTVIDMKPILWSGAQLKQNIVKEFFKACKKAETERGVEVTFMFEEMADVAMNLIEKPLLDKIAELEKLLKEAQAQ